jgi:glycosyltransferase involved in cell wall biosynthesis
MRVAFVYDWLDSWGGAERVLLELNRLFPQAPIYTSLYQKEGGQFAQKFSKIETSFLQKTSFIKRRWLTPLMPLAFETFNFDSFDLVISITSFAAKGIITKPQTKHICYLLTPTRFLWYPKQYQNLKIPKIVSNYLKSWDLVAAQRPDEIVSISKTVQDRCWKAYRRKSHLIYPPVDNKFLSLSHAATKKKFFLIVSRLEQQKKTDLAIRAFNDLGWPLLIIGTGSWEKKLKRMAKKNIRFLGRVSDQKLVKHYQEAQALIFPQEEDFGLVPLEAQACHTPVIAFDGGGATETVKRGQAGCFFYPQSSLALKKTLLKWSQNGYNTKSFRSWVKNFSQESFASSWQKLIKTYVTS